MEKNQYLYQQIRDYLLDIIALKHNAADYRLPSENQLCAKFGVSRISAKNAIARLQQENLVYRIRGKGTFIRGLPITALKPHAPFKNGIFCLVLPNLSSPFILDIIEGCQDFFIKNNEQIFIICTQNKQSLEIQAVQHMLEKNVRGFIIFPANGEQYNKELFKLVLNGFPIVFIDRVLTGFDISSVSTDHVASAFTATNYLISKGKKNIGIILSSPTNTSSLNDRLMGYEKAFIMNDLPIKINERLFLDRDEDFKSRIREFLQTNPQLDAIVSIGDKIGLDLYRTLEELRLQVPSELSLIFFDNEYETFKDFLPFFPTVIVQQAYQLGHEAARVLVSLVGNPEADITRMLIPSKLVLGQSTEG
ncbi:MAG: GntR family transcriptional regulator [Treponema sp.]|jgi:DNA-binding LacI/PurR family transcriptional regulator|nr:GntR family transcriptional regulator [Treponema sp.]